MYIPNAFRQDDIPVLQTFMQEYNFATLITQQDGIPFATHLPFLLDTERGPYGTLMGHIAVGNQQWRMFDPTLEALAIFQGPHAYISPSWYEVELSVPTWNYTAIHAYGMPKLIEDPTLLYTMLQALVEKHEASFERPWKFQLPDDYVQKMMRGIVGFEMLITRLEGKFKLSQNRTEREQSRVATALHQSSDTLTIATAELMNKPKP